MTAERGSNLLRFLQELSDAQELLTKFWSNPERTMAEAGLTDEERDLILRGDLISLRERLESEGAEGVVLVPRPWAMHVGLSGE
jgi:hypothetical protein